MIVKTSTFGNIRNSLCYALDVEKMQA